MYCLLMSEPQKTTACHIHAASALCRERHSSMSYCNWCTLGEFCCYKIVAMRLIKRSANIQQNAFGCYFCPFLCSSKNSMLTKKCTLCFFVNAHAKSTHTKRDCHQAAKRERADSNQSSGKRKWWPSQAGIPYRKLLFWRVSFALSSLL